MLLKDETIKRIRTGEITLIFRRWKKPGVKAGGTQMTQGGVIGIDAVDVVAEDEITDLEARDAGYASAVDLIEHLNYRDDPIYRIRVYFAGEDPRKALREKADLSDAELNEIIARLDRLDKNSKRGAWTQEYLQLIHDCPQHIRACSPSRAASRYRIKPWVRKLKALGLTESLEVGYRLSPRGEKTLAELRQKHAK
jgi:hypothetical protein